MKIEFYIKETGEVLMGDTSYHFVMQDRVYCDNCYSAESQCNTVTFEDFIDECPQIGFRVKSKID